MKSADQYLLDQKAAAVNKYCDEIVNFKSIVDELEADPVMPRDYVQQMKRTYEEHVRQHAEMVFELTKQVVS